MVSVRDRRVLKLREKTLKIRYILNRFSNSKSKFIILFQWLTERKCCLLEAIDLSHALFGELESLKVKA